MIISDKRVQIWRM